MKASSGNSAAFTFVDAHHHLWDLEAHHYAWLEGEGEAGTTGWLGDYAEIRRSYLAEEFISEAKACGMVKSVHVQANWSEPDTAGETRWLQKIADQHGIPNGIVGEVDLRSPDAGRELERHLECANFRGVRMLPMSGIVIDPAFQRGFAELGRRNLSYELNTRVPYMMEGVKLACKFPETLIIVGNTGNPLRRTDSYFEEWRRQMAGLAALPNVVVKISGLGMSDHRWSAASIRRWVLSTIDLFGPERCMFATNWPVDGLYSSYAQLIEAYRELTASFSPDEKEAMFRLNAERYYRI